MAAYRRRSRFRPYRARRVRRVFARRTLRSRFGRSSFMRRQRRNSRPEIKYLRKLVPLTSIPIFDNSVAGNNLTINILPLSIPVGDTGYNDRDGNTIKTRKCNISHRFTALSNISSTNSRPDCVVRIVIWACRVDYDKCLQYATSSTTLTPFPPQMFTVVKDTMVKVGNSGIGRIDGGTDTFVLNPNVYPSDVYRKWVVPHIRTIKFAPPLSTIVGTDEIDQERHQLYMTFINQSDWVIRTTGFHQVTFIDP